MKPISRLFSPLSAGAAFWLLVTALLTLVTVDHVIRERKLPPHPYVKATSALQAKLAQRTKPVQGRLFIYLVDSLRFDYAVDPALMPHLNRLLSDGVWGRVTPCSTNMTVHCVEAAFSGIDRSTVLAFGEDFNPHKSKHKTSWVFQMKNRDARITAVSDYVIPTLYSGAVAEQHIYRKGTSQRLLVKKALEQFSNPATNVTIVHLLGPHDDGQTFGSNTPQYKAQLREVDELLGEVAARLSPDDTLLVMGDHGMDDDGRHMYNMDVPTFYLYRGPDFVKNLRVDIHLLSHTFFLTALFRLPFYPEYQGDFHWDAFVPAVREFYGGQPVVSLSRPLQGARIHVNTEYKIRFLLLALLWVVGAALLWKAQAVPLSAPLAWLWGVGAVVLLYAGWFWALFVLQMAAGIFMLRGNGRLWLGFWAVAGAVLAWGAAKAWTYHAFDLAVHEVKIGFTYAFYGLELAAGVGLYALFSGRVGWRRLLWGGSLVAMVLSPFLHYPSLYAYGFLRSLPFFLSVHFFATAIFFQDPAFWLDGRREVRATAIPLLAALSLLPQYSMFVENFRIFDFPRLPHHEGAAWNAAIVGAVYLVSVACAFWMLRLRWKTWLFWLPAAVLPLAAWVGGAHVPPAVFGIALLGFIIFWNVKLQWMSAEKQWFVAFLWMQFVLSYSYIFSFQVFYQIQMLFLCALALLEEVHALEHNAPHLPRALIAVPAVAWVLLSYIAFFGIRTCGIDFRFALAWFPGLFETLWFLVFGATVFKYFALAFSMKAFEAARGRSLALGHCLRWAGFLVWAFLPMLVILLLRREPVPLVVDTLEEAMYLAGVVLLCLLLAVLPVRAFTPRTHAQEP